MRVTKVSFGKLCVSLAVSVISETVCFVIVTGSACSVDLARQLFSSETDENAGSLCFSCDFVDDTVLLFSVSYSSSQLHVCYGSDCVFKYTDDYRYTVTYLR